ncbi:MAG: hypothetical protein BGO34_10030 [Bacteroidia bacterium 44-10]|nr:MAG: hypothetical protein BGO34_10030 [Bacteroidia bacterium 44-10]
MKRFNKYITRMGLSILSLLLLSGCNSFDDINTNPDDTTTVSASLLATNVILQFTRFSGRDAKVMIGDNALPKYVGYANEGQMDQQYNKIGGGDFGPMTILPNIEKMIEYAEGGTMEDSYRGLGAFAKAYTFYRLTMEMGDIPYSEAGKGAQGVYKVKYDPQEQVLKGVLDELQDADQYFANGAIFQGDPTPYKGDPVKWRKALNSFALTVLMSVSDKESIGGINVKSRFAEIVSAGNLMDASTGFYGLSYSSQNRHPLSSTNDLFTSRTIVSSLMIDNLKLLNDRRMYYFAEPAGTLIAEGKEASDPSAYRGVDVDMAYAQMNADHSNNLYSLINKRYQLEEASEPLRLITFAEQQLVLAEGVLKGWITGDAKAYYESGVKAALTDVMTQASASAAHGMPVTQEYIETYFSGEAAFKAAADDQLKQIWMQRYILQFMQDPKSSYFAYRRNKYPVFPVNPETSLNENNKNGIPMRWLYPGSEANYNRENLEEALERQYDGYDEINKIMWILK